MNDPVFDIHLGTNSIDSTVTVNGHDITGAIRGVKVELLAGSLTKLTLFVRPGHARTTVEAAIADVTLTDPAGVDAPVDEVET